MSRWFRFYEDAMHDPKVLRLSDSAFRAWVTMLCFASKNDGKLPSVQDMSVELRCKPAVVAAWLAELTSAGLIDKNDEGFEPHNWAGRQFKSDVSTDRVKRFRNNRRNVSETLHETLHETEVKRTRTDTDTEQNRTDSVANATGAVAPVDHRKRLFDEGLPRLAAMTGKGPDACRSFVGKCLSAANDDAIVVLGLIEDAERNRVADPTAWIAARLKTGKSNERVPENQSLSHIARRHAEQGIAFGERPSATGLRLAAGGADVRLLPQSGSK